MQWAPHLPRVGLRALARQMVSVLLSWVRVPLVDRVVQCGFPLPSRVVKCLCVSGLKSGHRVKNWLVVLPVRSVALLVPARLVL